MAGLSLPVIGGLGQGILNGQQAIQDRQNAALDQEIRKLQIQSIQAKNAAEQAATLRQQNADTNAAAVIQSYYGAQQQQPQQAPALNLAPPQPPQPQMAPGQPSVPMIQPGQQPPPIPPQGMPPQGQMPPPGIPPLPPGMPGQGPAAQPRAQQPQQPQQPPPYRRIDTQLQQQPQPPAQPPQQSAPIPQQAPAQGSLTFQDAARMLAQKGVTGPALVDALDRIKPYLDEQAKQQAEAMKQQLQIAKLSNDSLRLELQGKHYEALEANAAARTELEAQRLRIEASSKAQSASQREREISLHEQQIAQSKIPNGYERDPQTGKLKPMEGGPYDPNSPNYKAPKGAAKGGTIADRMNPTMLASVKLDIQEGRNALDTVKKLNTDTAGPYFAHDQASPLSTILGRALTTEQQQQYEVAMNRMAVAIASVQSMGRGQISDAKVNEARKLVPQLGDKPATRQLKLQQINKIFDLADRTLNEKSGGNPNEPDGDREAATAGSVPGGGNAAPPKTVNWNDLK